MSINFGKKSQPWLKKYISSKKTHNISKAVIILFAVIGLATLLPSRAATPSIGIEAENSNIIGAEKYHDTSASGQYAIKFKGAKTTNTPFSVTATADIALSSDGVAHKDTADLIERINPTYAIAMGDIAYSKARLQDFQLKYHPFWGKLSNIIKPLPGNHEYLTEGAAGYFDYFDPNNTGKFGKREHGYYSFTKDNWLFLMINSECNLPYAEGCENGKKQANWVDAQLAAHPDKCIVASWHRPRISYGRYSGFERINDIWNKIVARKGVVLVGHNHLYARTIPVGTNGVSDPINGITQFTVGTGGATLYPPASTGAVLEAAKLAEHGVLKMTMNGNKIDYQFININNVVRDKGTLTLGC